MIARRLIRATREGVTSIFRSGWLSFASVNAMALALFVLGLFLILFQNIQHLTEEVESQVEMQIFLDVTVDRQDALQVGQWLRERPEIRTVNFVPKEEGLEELKQRLGDDAVLLEGLEEENPLPDKFVIQAYQPEDLPFLSRVVLQRSEVESVDYGQEYLDLLIQFTDSIRWVGLVLVVLMALTALFLISNTIRITIGARSREIEIMKLVGATRGFIRGPFLIEGMLLGLMGGLIPALLLAAGYTALWERAADFLARYGLTLLEGWPLVAQVGAVLMVVGAIIGGLGSVLSMRRFIRV